MLCRKASNNSILYSSFNLIFQNKEKIVTAFSFFLFLKERDLLKRSNHHIARPLFILMS